MIYSVQIIDNNIILARRSCSRRTCTVKVLHRVGPPEHLRLQITPETCVYKVFFREIEIGEFDLKLCGLGLSRGAMIC